MGRDAEEPDSPEELAHAFQQSWAAGGAVLECSPELGARLASALTVGRSTWPTVALPGSTFAAHLGRLLAEEPAGASAAEEALSTLHVDDLFLACGCAAGLPRALELFEARYLAPLPQILRGLAVSVDGVDEVQELLRHKLLVGGDGHPPRIAAYAGRGPLAAWVAIAAQRTALSLHRGAGAQQRAHERAMREAITAELDPELRYMKMRYQRAFETAFTDTLKELLHRDRTLLRLSLVGRLSLEALGTSYNVNPSTVSRWLAKIRQQILDGTMARLRERLKLSAAEVASLARLLTSQLDISMTRLLETQNGARPPGAQRE